MRAALLTLAAVLPLAGCLAPAPVHDLPETAPAPGTGGLTAEPPSGPPPAAATGPKHWNATGCTGFRAYVDWAVAPNVTLPPGWERNDALLRTWWAGFACDQVAAMGYAGPATLLFEYTNVAWPPSTCYGHAASFLLTLAVTDQPALADRWKAAGLPVQLANVTYERTLSPMLTRVDVGFAFAGWPSSAVTMVSPGGVVGADGSYAMRLLWPHATGTGALDLLELSISGGEGVAAATGSLSPPFMYGTSTQGALPYFDGATTMSWSALAGEPHAFADTLCKEEVAM